MITFSIQEINKKLNGVLEWNTTQLITGTENLEWANNLNHVNHKF